MGVAYNGNAIIPAPLVTFHKKYVASEDGTIIGSVYAIVIRGKLSAWKGSPNSQGVFWNQGGGTYPPDETIDQDHRLGAIERKQEALRKLFSTEGQTLEWDPIYPDSSAPIRCNPRIKEIEFPEGLWYETCDYTITLEADVLLGVLTGNGEDNFGGYLIDKAQDDWSLEPADDIARTYRLTHTVTAVGKRSYDSVGNLINGGAWQNAKAWVQAHMGIDPNRLNPSGILTLQDPKNYDNANYTPNPQAFNFIRAEHVNEMAGHYGVTETWLVFDANGLAAPAIEEFNVTSRTDETGRTHVSIEGTIHGLEERDSTTHQLEVTRFTNANTYWNSINSSLLQRAQNYASLSLNPKVLSSSVGINDIGGTITYHYEYDNRPASIVTGSISEHLTVTFDNPADVVAKQVVIGRLAGPIIQPIGTVTEKHKTVTLEAQMPACVYNGNALVMPDTDALFAEMAPVPSITFWVEKDTPSFNYTTGQYSRTVTWGYE